MVMQRVSSLLPSWDRSRSSASSYASSHTHKNSVDKVRGWADRIPSSRSSRVGKENFWPTTLDKECEKAARILKSFCSDGFSAPDDRPGTPQTHSSSQSSSKKLKKIPPKMMQNAVGLAIFTSMRSGLWTSDSGGSGILIARKTDGSWSPPSGLVMQTPSLGFVIGVDIYDCVLVINNFTVLEAFARPKLTLGTDVTLSTGPLVALGLLENDVTWTDLSDAAITYVKARGQVSEVKLEGTVIQERREENERFYGTTMGVAKILSGDVNLSLPQLRPLTEVLKAAEGRVDYDTALVESLSSQPAPGDTTVEPSTASQLSPAFGMPIAEDPDPFGILALEQAGVGIREAGTHLRPDSSQFEYHPSPTSPVFSKTKRRSFDTATSHSNRGSYISSKTVGTEKSQITDTYAQNYSSTPETTPAHSQSQSEDGHQQHLTDEAQRPKEPIELDFARIDITSLRKLSNFPDLDEPLVKTETSNKAPMETKINNTNDGKNPKSEPKYETSYVRSPVHTVNEESESDLGDEVDDDGSHYGTDDDLDGEDCGSDYDDDLDDDEEAVVFEVATAQPPTRMTVVGAQVMQAKGAVVNIPKRAVPPLPVRSPARASRRRSQMPDVSGLVGSPLRKEFDPVEISGTTTPRASKVLEPTDATLGTYTSGVMDNSARVDDFESSPDSDRTMAPVFQERSAKRASHVVQGSSTREQTSTRTGHKVSVSVS